MAGNEQTEDVRIQPPATRGFFSEYLEYLLVAVVAILVGGGVALWARGQHTTTTDQSHSSQAVKACAASGFGNGSRKEGTCSTPGAVLTFVNGRKPLTLPGVRAQIDRANALTASTPAGRARNRSRVVVRLHLTNTGRTELTPGPNSVYLTIGRARVDPNPAAARVPDDLDMHTPMKPGASRAGLLRFELAGGQTTRFIKSGGQLGVHLAPPAAGKDQIGVIRFSASTVKPAPGHG